MLDAPQHVLFATDLQARARPRFDFVRAYARATGAELTLLHSVEATATRGVTRALRQTLLDRQTADAERAMEVHARAAREAGITVRDVKVSAGVPAYREILSTIDAIAPDLVVVGSVAREGHGRRIGSTADRLLRSSGAPVLVLRGDRMEMPLHAVALLTDFSPQARRAHQAAIRLLPTPEQGSRIELLHADVDAYRALDPSLEERISTQLTDEAAALTRDLPADAPPVTPRLVWGEHPVDTALAAVEEGDNDLLVLGTHGHGAVRRALIGSVAMGLAQSAPCPVLVVPGT